MVLGSNYRILVVDADPSARETIAKHLSLTGYDVLAYATMAEALENSLESIDVVVTQLLIDPDAVLLCRAARARTRAIPIIILTEVANMAMSAAALRVGAFDFLVKPIQPLALTETIERAIEQAANYLAPGILVGDSAAMIALRDRIAKLGPSDAPVLVTGEAGSGKDLVARALQAASSRANGMLFVINCGSSPLASLLDVTLANFSRSGTVLFDEIEELPLEIQARLLIAIQERATSPEMPVGVRVIASTRHDLAALVAQGKFREELYFRLAVLHVAVPPLRDRGNDILVLAHNFTTKQLAPDVEARLLAYGWPGNVRELEGAMLHAHAMAPGERIELEHLPDRVRIVREQAQPIEEQLLSLAELERRHVRRVLERCKNNKAAAARVLGIERKTLYRMLDRWSAPSPVITA